MRPGVIRAHGDAAAEPALEVQLEAVVVPRAAVILLYDGSEVLALRGIQQIQHAALVQILKRGAHCVRNTVDRARLCSQKNAWIGSGRGQQMQHLISEIVHRSQPVGSKLPLDTESPLLDIGHLGVVAKAVERAKS